MDRKTPESLSPSDWLVRWAGCVPAASRVLDVACGSGRHSRLFLGCGHEVVGVDRDLGGVADLRSAEPRFRAVEADLESGAWPFEGERFAAVVVTNYLWRPLFSALVASVADNGVLIYETFAVGNEKFGRPRNPDFLLRAGELLDRVEPLEVVAFEQGRVTTSSGTRVVQRIVAARPGGMSAELR